MERVRKSGVRLQLNGQTGTPQEILPLLSYEPDVLLVDDPARLKATLDERKRHTQQFDRLSERVNVLPETTVVPWIAQTGAATFLNRDYSMLELPKALDGQPRLMFAGGEGNRVVLGDPALLLYYQNRLVSFAEDIASPDQMPAACEIEKLGVHR